MIIATDPAEPTTHIITITIMSNTMPSLIGIMSIRDISVNTTEDTSILLIMDTVANMMTIIRIILSGETAINALPANKR